MYPVYSSRFTVFTITSIALAYQFNNYNYILQTFFNLTVT